MKHSLILFVLLTVFTVSSINGQKYHTERGFNVHTGVVVLPKVEGNGSLDNTPLSAFIGIGAGLKIDGIKVEGELDYIPAKLRLYTVGALLTFDSPIGQGPIDYPFKIGISYRAFVSFWDLHCAGAVLRYEKKDWFIGTEFGFATRSLKSGRTAAGYALITYGLKFNWRY